MYEYVPAEKEYAESACSFGLQDIFVSRVQTARGWYINACLRNGFMRFNADVQENRRGLLKLHRLADLLGVPLLIADEVKAAMDLVE